MLKQGSAIGLTNGETMRMSGFPVVVDKRRKSRSPSTSCERPRAGPYRRARRAHLRDRAVGAADRRSRSEPGPRGATVREEES